MRHLITYVILFSNLFFLSSCILMSDAYYNAKKSEWDAKKAASIAWSKRSTVLATFTTKDGEKFIVNNPNQLKPIEIKAEPNAVVEGFNTVFNSPVLQKATTILGGGWAAGYILGKVNKGDTNYSNSGEGAFNVTENSYNPIDTTNRFAETGGSITEETHENSDYDASQVDTGNDKSTTEDYDQRHDYDQENMSNEQPDNSNQDQRSGSYTEYNGSNDFGNTDTDTTTTQP